MLATMKLDLFAGIPVREYAAAKAWYERLLGFPPTFFPHETEAVWELAEHRYLYIVQQPEHAGHARLTLFAEGLDSLLASVSARGLSAIETESYANGVRKVTFRDPDGNEVSFGGAPRNAAARPRRVRKPAREAARTPRAQRSRERRRASR
jgi:catechol 2,3-dioxygenase-like lactoylglutathione lyase family enzyme